MLNFIKADLLRVLTKKSYLITTSTVLALYAITLIIVLIKSPDGVGLVSSLLASGAVLLIGIPVFTAVFTDDFNSKAMQTIIGFGTSRKKLVLSRYCEYLVILAQAFAIVSALCFIIFAVAGHIPESAPLFKDLWKEYLLTALCVGAAMIFVYGMQNPTFGLVIFICLVVDIFSLVLTGLSFIPFFMERDIDLSMILPSNLIYSAMNDGKPLCYLWAALGYIALPLIISVKVFEKKELEF